MRFFHVQFTEINNGTFGFNQCCGCRRDTLRQCIIIKLLNSDIQKITVGGKVFS